MNKIRGVWRVYIGMSEGKRSLGRPERIRENNIKMDLKYFGIDGVNRIQQAHVRVL
jgi:hypothetical protein